MRSLARMFGRTGIAAIAALGLAAAVGGPVSAQPALGPLTFTAAQANNGAAVFANVCAGCHGANLQGGGGPPLIGGAFDSYRNGAVRALFSYISQNMPADNPGGLTPEQYINLVAFIARSNGFTAGAAPLPMNVDMLGAMGFTQ